MPENDLTIREAQSEVEEFLKVKRREWTRIQDPFFRATFLVEEVGELARSLINLSDEEPRRKGQSLPQDEKLALVKDSLGDILFHLFTIATAHEIDMQEAFQCAMHAIKAKYLTSSS